MFKIKPFATILLLQFIVIFQGFAQVSNPRGSLNKITADDIWAHTLEGSYFNEFWTYHFFLDDGMKVHITFSVANFGSLKAPVSGVQVSVDRLNGQLYQLSREYNINHLVQDKSNYVFRNRIDRELFFEGKLPEKHRVRIQTSKDGVNYDIDLEIFNIVNGFKWGDGKYQVNNELVGVYTHIPYAEVKGYVEVDNHRKIVNGSVYMDHVFQQQTTTRLIDSGYRFIYHEDSKNWDILHMMLPDNTGDRNVIGHRIVNRNGKVEVQGLLNIEQFSARNTFGEEVAWEMDIRISNSDTLRLTRRSDTEKFSLLSELGRFARRAARTFLGGEVIHFRGDAVLLEPDERPVRGHYNFLIVS
jgi:hypothetical protein